MQLAWRTGVRSRQPRLPPLSRDRRPAHAHHAVARRRVRPDGRLEKPRDERAEIQLLGSRPACGLASRRRTGSRTSTSTARARGTDRCGPWRAGGPRPPSPAENSPTLGGLGPRRRPHEERFTERRPREGRRAWGAGGEVQPARSSASGASRCGRRAQWAIASQPAVKIGVRAPGMVPGDPARAVAAGLEPAGRSRYAPAVPRGRRAAHPRHGSGDGQFNPADAIEFYGTGVDTPSTDTAVYWLTGGTGTGLRVQTAPRRGPGRRRRRDSGARSSGRIAASTSPRSATVTRRTGSAK